MKILYFLGSGDVLTDVFNKIASIREVYRDYVECNYSKVPSDLSMRHPGFLGAGREKVGRPRESFVQKFFGSIRKVQLSESEETVLSWRQTGSTCGGV